MRWSPIPMEMDSPMGLKIPTRTDAGLQTKHTGANRHRWRWNRDGVEDHDLDGVRSPRETDPRVFDTDGDGLHDGQEDRNHDGQQNPGETDALIRTPMPTDCSMARKIAMATAWSTPETDPGDEHRWGWTPRWRRRHESRWHPESR